MFDIDLDIEESAKEFERIQKQVIKDGKLSYSEYIFSCLVFDQMKDELFQNFLDGS